MTIPVYICGGLSFLLAASFSDRWGIRGPFVFLTNIPGIIGYILILCPTPNGVKFFGTFLCSIAVYNGPGLNLTWLNVNVAPHYRRAAAIGFQQTIGNTAGGKSLLYNRDLVYQHGKLTRSKQLSRVKSTGSRRMS